ncbi:MAG: protein kinase [Myxococcota bacterium]
MDREGPGRYRAERTGPGRILSAWAESHIGTPLGRGWTLDTLVAKSAVTAVFGATHRNGQRVGIRMLYPSLAGVEEVRARFLEDAYTANAIDHFGAVKVLGEDVGDDGQTVYLVTELLDGQSLAARLADEGRLEAPAVVPIIDALLEAFEQAHGRGVIHGGLEPASVLLPRTGRPRVLDFGVGRLRQLEGFPANYADGAVVGASAFWAPEQARRSWADVDERSDVFALGALVYTMLTGETLQAGDGEDEIRVATATQPAPSILGRAGVPPDLAAVVDGALGYKREDRFQTVGAMRRALRTAAKELLPEMPEGQVEYQTQVMTDTRAHFAILDAAHEGTAVPPPSDALADFEIGPPTIPDGVERQEVAAMIAAAKNDGEGRKPRAKKKTRLGHDFAGAPTRVEPAPSHRPDASVSARPSARPQSARPVVIESTPAPGQHVDYTQPKIPTEPPPVVEAEPVDVPPVRGAARGAGEADRVSTLPEGRSSMIPSMPTDPSDIPIAGCAMLIAVLGALVGLAWVLAG